jgi:Resolvase, N terminal domain
MEALPLSPAGNDCPTTWGAMHGAHSSRRGGRADESGRLHAHVERDQRRADKDSEKRQRAAIEGYAKRAGMSVVDWFYDPAVSGADPIETRPGFAALLDRIEGNGVRVVLIEDATRFARDLVA